ATGNSGRRILRLALQRAYEVTAFVRDETKLLSLVDRPIPPNLHVSIGDISKSADIARVMVGHDVAINAAGSVTEGSTFTQLVQTVIDSTITSLGEGGRLWQFSAAILNVPGMHIMTVDLPKVPKVYEAHRTNLDALRRSPLDWSLLCPGPIIASTNGKPTGDLRLTVEEMTDDTTCLHLRSAQIGLGVCFQAKSAGVDYLIRRRGRSDPRQSLQKRAVLSQTSRGRSSGRAAQL